MRIERPGRATRPGGASPRTDTQIPRRKQPAAAKVDTGHQVGKFDEQLWATWVSVIIVSIEISVRAVSQRDRGTCQPQVNDSCDLSHAGDSIHQVCLLIRSSSAGGAGPDSIAAWRK